MKKSLNFRKLNTRYIWSSSVPRRSIMETIKDEVHKLADGLKESSTWDDVMYQIYVRKKIDAGLRAVDEGKVVSHEKVKEIFS